VPRSRIIRAAATRSRAMLLAAAGMPLAHVARVLAETTGCRLGAALVYHRVGDPPGDPRRELVPALGRTLFAAQVRHLVSSYRVVEGSQLLAAAAARRRGERFPLAITFDDDLSSHVEEAAPILTAAGATATFFLSGTSLSAPHRFWWERLQAAFDARLELAAVGLDREAGVHELGRRIEMLPRAERDRVDAALVDLLPPDPPESGLRLDGVRGLVEAGFEIGFHTRRHDLLTTLADDELDEAMHAGRGELEAAVGARLATIAYPHGRADERVGRAAADAGFAVGFTGNPVVVTADADPLLLGRIAPSYRSCGALAFDVAWALLLASLSGRARARPALRAE
jgi:peptidoglycan/xylan/chitin deacetylase (PgdA/CDA1 family)